MSKTTCKAGILGRAVLGVFAELVLGCFVLLLFGERIFSYYPPQDGFGPLLIVTGIAGIAGAVLGAVAGAWEIRGRAANSVVGALAGSVLGLLAVLVYGAFVAQGDDGKEMGAYIWVAVLLGMPTGGVLGGLAGIVWPSKSKPPTPSGESCDRPSP